MKHGSYRDTWVEVSLDAIRENVKAFKGHIHNNCRLMAVVKADGYGHGAVEIAKTAIQSGADYLAVALLDEAMELRDAGIDFPILVLGYTPPSAAEDAIMNDIALTVFTQDVIKRINDISEENEKKARIHIKIDTGMSRIGLISETAVFQLIQSISSPFVLIEGIFTHFADADNVDSAYTNKQFNRFNKLIDYLEEHDVQIPIKHCCNSAGTIAYPEMHLDMVRVGVSMYGLYPSEHLQEKISLRQAMSFKTKSVMTKTVPIGQPISYGCTYAPAKNSTITTIPVGYADGFSRALSNTGNVTINGQRAPIVGRICMDQAMINVTEIEPFSSEDVITIFGDPGDGYISLAEVADQMHTIHYEAASLIGKRVPRIYIRENKMA
ncbi:alanine racemase [Virgibacillus oceani]|uniref:Alanine racemase n=1 Tax=Virgibacillus oceani TaxID=1479511 RepID=A0A917HMB4_9BACI|nr:alanine racemase [Virgibacillus oceani]GGG83257.1 alanine racemase [Virgibacillus oceani]